MQIEMVESDYLFIFAKVKGKQVLYERFQKYLR